MYGSFSVPSFAPPFQDNRTRKATFHHASCLPRLRPLVIHRHRRRPKDHNSNSSPSEASSECGYAAGITATLHCASDGFSGTGITKAIQPTTSHCPKWTGASYVSNALRFARLL